MNLLDLIRRDDIEDWPANAKPVPWEDRGFSERMLREHLSQEHDVGTRRKTIVEKQASWVHSTLLAGHRTRILDLGCGPGLYSHEFAQLGHQPIGIDYSPASIDFARRVAKAQKLRCEFRLEDFLSAEYGQGFGLALLTFGDLNTFIPDDGRRILTKIYQSLAPRGMLLLEPLSFAAVEKIGNQESSWYSEEAGIFAAEPHICLEECDWDPEEKTAAVHYYILHAAQPEIDYYLQKYYAFSDDELQKTLLETGFSTVEFYPGFTQTKSDFDDDLIALVARK